MFVIEALYNTTVIINNICKILNLIQNIGDKSYTDSFLDKKNLI